MLGAETVVQEPAWLGRQRGAEWEKFSSLPWPTSKDEGWRKTLFHGWQWQDLPLIGSGTSAVVEIQGVPPGVIAGNLSELAQTNPDLVQKFLTVPGSDTTPLQKLNALNRARWTHGVFVYVPKGITAEQPLRITFNAGTENTLLAPRTLVVLEAGSELTIIQETVGETGQGPSFIPALTELVVGENATLHYHHVQNWGRHVQNFYTQQAALAANATLTTLLASLGSHHTKAVVGASLNGTGARSNLYGITFGDNDQRFEYHTLQDHVVGHTSSDLLYKTALRDSAFAFYTGLIRIDKKAIQSNAYQANRNLLLSNDAQADSIPMLEILTDDVRCTHAAAVGPVDPDQMFYLTSRGVDPETAQRMIVEGFFEQVLQLLPATGLRDRIHTQIERKLGIQVS